MGHPRTISEWAADAADVVQYACNLSGLVFAFEQCVQDLAEEARQLGQNDEWIDRHPICILWADKLDDLSSCRGKAPLSTEESLTSLVPQFATLMQELCEESQQIGEGTDWRNRHPQVQEVVRKLVAVTGSRAGLTVFHAFEECERISRVAAENST